VIDEKFYKAFEERHRGSRDLIKSRLRIYLPFVLPIKAKSANCEFLDLGCGRGEWLELMKDEGIKAQGVDDSEEMLACCKEQGLGISKCDAIIYLKNLPNECISAITGFHLIEHLSFNALQELTNEAYRVLKPGGLLILETPNPENIIVGTTNFYMDPTHLRPIPPSLLSFLAEYHGFGRIKILRLQESPELIKSKEVSLTDIISGVSPDYAIIAQKDAPVEYLTLFNAPFNKEYGLTLEALSLRYEIKMRQFAAEAFSSKVRIDEIDRELQAVYSSRCWRITAPMRTGLDLLLRIKSAFANLLQMIKSKMSSVLNQSLIAAIHLATIHPFVKAKASTIVHHFPRFNTFLYNFALSHSIICGTNIPQSLDMPLPISPLSRCVYAELKAEIERNRRCK
jgi:SAM-dependent methyltransferase